MTEQDNAADTTSLIGNKPNIRTCRFITVVLAITLTRWVLSNSDPVFMIPQLNTTKKVLYIFINI